VVFEGESGRILAQGVADAIDLAVSKGVAAEDAVAVYVGTPRSLLVRHAYARWIAHLRVLQESGDRSKKTVDEYDRIGRTEIGWWGDRSVRDVSTASIEDWVGHLQSRGLQAKSRKNYTRALSACLGWLNYRDEIAAVPRFPEISSVDRLPTIVSPEDMDVILSRIEYRAQGPILIGARMGLRPGEIRALDVSDVERNADSGWRLHVSKAVQGPNSDDVIGPTKSRADRKLPIHPEVREWMEAHVDWKDRLLAKPLCLNGVGKRLAHGSLTKLWARARRGITTAGLYEGTKHSFATEALRSGIPLERIQKFLGHADISSTLIYARIEAKDLEVFARPRS